MAQRSARNPGSGRFNFARAAAAAACLLLAGAGCRRPAEPAPPAARATLLWPGTVPVPPECLAGPPEAALRWGVAGTDEPPDVVLVADPEEAECQPLDDLLRQTVLLVGEPAPGSAPIEGAFAQLGFHELQVRDALELWPLLDRLAVDLVVLCMADPEGRAELAGSLAAREPPVRFTTYQPERGQTDLPARTRDLLGPPARPDAAGLLSSQILVNARGQAVGLRPPRPPEEEEEEPGLASAPPHHLGLRRHLAARAARQAAFAAIRCWAGAPPPARPAAEAGP